MISPPRTLAEARAYRYGDWAGNPKGVAYRAACCAYEVWPKGRFIPSQCSRPAVAGPAKLYCRVHARRVA